MNTAPTPRRGSIVITGASAGLGSEMARQFAALGYDLGLAARRLDRLDSLRDEITARYPTRRVEVIELDVTDGDAVHDAVNRFDVLLGGIDRLIANAGSGKGAALGTGGWEANRQTAETNFVGVLAQADAAMGVFRRQRSGHMVLISSMSAVRGMRRSMTTYAASKAGVAAIAEGLRAENLEGIDVSVILPGYIASEMNAHVRARTPFLVDTETGVAAMVAAIERRRAKAFVPAWPWALVGMAMRILPLRVVRKLT
ncbi:SDR family oxidoreductase [Rhodococcoides fascians]|uniref:SDR family oxidoreductase n=1 Tax=Rhodococcoides fascians TaxID=1828 RepID=UPI00050C5795|nr:SDR family oxidoreductase [Rhodococcus fascians]